jgi:hypothetical protein
MQGRARKAGNDFGAVIRPGFHIPFRLIRASLPIVLFFLSAAGR